MYTAISLPEDDADAFIHLCNTHYRSEVILEMPDMPCLENLTLICSNRSKKHLTDKCFRKRRSENTIYDVVVIGLKIDNIIEFSQLTHADARLPHEP